MALPTGWLAVRARGRVATLLERSTYLGSAVPGIVVALALVTLSIRATPWLYQTVPVLLAAYAILFLPRAIVTVRAAVEQSPPVYDDVASSLGASAPDRLRRVTLPLLAPGIGAGAALVFLAVVTELTATLLLRPPERPRWRRRSGPRAARWSTGRRPRTPSSWCCSPRPLPCCCPVMPDEV